MKDTLLQAPDKLGTKMLVKTSQPKNRHDSEVLIMDAK